MNTDNEADGTDGAGPSARDQRRNTQEHAQMLALLRHFAETFGPDEIYRQARTIYLETPEGAREIQEEYARVRDEDPLGGGRAPSPRPPAGHTRRESAYDEAKRLLGG